jgi:hypothetical protein
MTGNRFGPKSTENDMNDFIWLVNNTPRVIPQHIGTVEGLCPSIVYSKDDGKYSLHMGNSQEILVASCHKDIAKAEAPVGLRRISAVTVLAESGIHLAIDGDRTKKLGGLAVIKASMAKEFDEVFIGGLSEDPDVLDFAKTMCTVGLIREASTYARLAGMNGLNRRQTATALSLFINQQSQGISLRAQDVITLVKSNHGD